MVPINSEPPPEVHASARFGNNNRRAPLISTIPNILSDRPRRKYSFFDVDGPGEIADNGPRHDNDYADFRDIHILPTVDEILAVNRPVYMPKKNFNQPHFINNSPARILDTHFRHLRYESTEAIRDICYTAVQQTFLEPRFGKVHDVPCQETTSGNRYHSYNVIKIEDLIAHEKKGMLVRLSFACPPSLRGPLMHKSNRLQSGMLCALLAMDIFTQELSIIYFDIHLRESTLSMQSRGAGSQCAAVQLALHHDTSHSDVLRISRLAIGLDASTVMALVEFPKVLHAGFYQPLRRLQQIKVDDIAFTKYLNLHKSSNEKHQNPPHVDIEAPDYAKSPGFTYDLSPLTKNIPVFKPLQAFIGPCVPSTVEYLQQSTTLDEGQAIALCNTLGRKLSFIQGPPGTGKTYLGVALAQVLLASRLKSNQKPIIVVCLTNHALDAFLAGLRDAGVENLVRIGSGSKEEWTKAINLREKVRKTRFKNSEFGDLRGLRSQKKHVFGELMSWCESVSREIETGRPNWHQIAPVLKRHYRFIYDQLTTATSTPETQSLAFDYWAAGGDLNHIRTLHKELSERLLMTAHSKPKAERDFVEQMLEDISKHAEDMSHSAGSHDIWNLTPVERRRFLGE